MPDLHFGSCVHGDIQLCEHDGKRCVACFACGRLFGWLGDDETFVAYNPPRDLTVEPICATMIDVPRTAQTRTSQARQQ